jgi:uncharacterized protein YkwD
MKSVIVIFFLFVSLFSFSQDVKLLESEIYSVFKKHKVSLNNNAVILNAKMSESCRDHSRLMYEYGDLFHVESFDTILGTSEIIQQNHNLMRTNKEVANAVLKAFLDSPSHKEILEQKSKEIGIGVYVDSKNLVWVTVRFF